MSRAPITAMKSLFTNIPNPKKTPKSKPVKPTAPESPFLTQLKSVNGKKNNVIQRPTDSNAGV